VLQCGAVWCSVLQCAFRTSFDSTRHAVCNVLQCVVVRCSALQCVALRYSAVCRSALQCVFCISFDCTQLAVCCSALQRVFRQLFDCTRHAVCNVLQRVAVCCGALQCVAMCIPHIFRQHTTYSTQCVAVRCSAVCCSAVCCSAVCCSAVCCSAVCCSAVCCSAPQCVISISFDCTRHAVPCNVLQRITLQVIAVHCNMFFADFRLHTTCSLICSMGWLRLVGSLKLKVSFLLKIPFEKDNILQKRPMILTSLLIVATPHERTWQTHDMHTQLIRTPVCDVGGGDRETTVFGSNLFFWYQCVLIRVPLPDAYVWYLTMCNTGTLYQ